MPEIIYTDLYPTRYTAFHNPDRVVIFRPRKDGMFRHCREDAPYEPVSSLGRVVGVACYLGSDGCWGEVRTAPKGFYVRADSERRGNPVGLSATCQDGTDALAKLVAFVTLIEKE